MIYPEAAYPIVVDLAMDARIEQAGLTKRELFAAMAMQGYCATMGPVDPALDRCAEMAVRAADALLAELAKARE